MRLTPSRFLVFGVAVVLLAAGAAFSSDDETAAAAPASAGLEDAARTAVAETPPAPAPKPVPTTPEPRRLWGGDDGEIRLLGREAALRFAQELVAERGAADRSVWSEDLIRQRRAESDRE